MPNFDTVDPNLKPMSQDAFNAGSEYQLNQNTVFTANYVHNDLRRTIEDLGVLENGNEVYKYVNPGEGIAKTMNPSGLTPVFPTPKPKRQYDALELTLDAALLEELVRQRELRATAGCTATTPGLSNSDEISTPTTNRTSGDGTAAGRQHRAPGQQRQPRVGPRRARVGLTRQPGRARPAGHRPPARREAVRLVHAADRHAGGRVLLRRQRHAGEPDGSDHQPHPDLRGRPRQPRPHAVPVADRPARLARR